MNFSGSHTFSLTATAKNCFRFALPAGMLLQSEMKIESDLRLPKSWITCFFMIFTYRTIQNGGKIIGGALASTPPPPPPSSPGSAVPGSILSYLTCMLPYHIVRKHIFNQEPTWKEFRR